MTGFTRRNLWREYQNDMALYPMLREQWWQRYIATGVVEPLPSIPKLPIDVVRLVCGAKTRSGAPCKRRDLYINGRCRLHGGLSTGPKTEQGKKRSARNGKMPKNKRTP